MLWNNHYGITNNIIHSLFVSPLVSLMHNNYWIYLLKVAKFVTCNAVVLMQSNYNIRIYFAEIYHHIRETPMEVLKVSVPSFLYVIQNNLLYLALSNLDAATYQVCYQLKILTTALFSATMLQVSIVTFPYVFINLHLKNCMNLHTFFLHEYLSPLLIMIFWFHSVNFHQRNGFHLYSSQSELQSFKHQAIQLMKPTQKIKIGPLAYSPSFVQHVHLDFQVYTLKKYLRDHQQVYGSVIYKWAYHRLSSPTSLSTFRMGRQWLKRDFLLDIRKLCGLWFLFKQ